MVDVLTIKGDYVSLLGWVLRTEDATLTPQGVGVVATVISTIACWACYKLSRVLIPIAWPGYKSLKLADQRDFDTRLNSLTHAVLIVVYAYLGILGSDLYWKADPTPVMHRISSTTYLGLGISLGYFIVDLICTIKYIMGGPEMVLHHVGSFASVAAAFFSGECHLYTLWMLATEATTPFISARWVLDKMGFKTSKVYLYNGLCILVSWLIFRLCIFPSFFLNLWLNRSEITQINPLSKFLLLVFPCVLFSLNLYWFTKIVKGAMKAFGIAQKPVEKKE